MLVKNILKIQGGNIQAILDKIKGENGLIDFDAIAPMPAPLHRTVFPDGIITQEEYNQSQNTFYITHEISDQYRKLYGHDNWHDWRVANWGTPRYADNISMVNNHTIAFTTEQTPPLKLIQTLSEMFPDVTFKLYFTIEGKQASILTFKTINDPAFAEVVSEIN